MHINGKAFRTIWFDENSQAGKIINQTKLPHQFIIKDLKTVKDAINAIKTIINGCKAKDGISYKIQVVKKD